jgi:hypothetical protein
MNERLKELAIEAKLIASEPNGFDPTRLTIAQQKFAELIVRECANIFDKDEMELTLTKRTIHNMIKEHFGIE